MFNRIGRIQLDIMRKHESRMAHALREAKIALDEGEVPVGAVIVKEGKIIARGHNRRESLTDPTAHAEILAITSAANQLEDWRLEGCTMYVTLEPCPMCAGAAVNAKLEMVIFGTRDADVGACGTVYDLLNGDNLIHKVRVLPDVLAEECKGILSEFFSAVRKREKSDSN